MRKTATWMWLLRALLFVTWLGPFLELAGISNMVGRGALGHPERGIPLWVAGWALTWIMRKTIPRPALYMNALVRFTILFICILGSKYMSSVNHVLSLAVVGCGVPSWADGNLIPKMLAKMRIPPDIVGAEQPARPAMDDYFRTVTGIHKAYLIGFGVLATLVAIPYTLLTVYGLFAPLGTEERLAVVSFYLIADIALWMMAAYGLRYMAFLRRMRRSGSDRSKSSGTESGLADGGATSRFAENKMRKKVRLAVVCTIVVTVLLLLTGVYVTAARAARLDRTSHEYACNSLEHILGTWDIQELSTRATDELKQRIERERWHERFDQYRQQLGSLTTLGTAKGQATIYLSLFGRHQDATADYGVEAHFKNSKLVDVRICLSKHEDRWLVSDLALFIQYRFGGDDLVSAVLSTASKGTLHVTNAAGSGT